MSGGYWDKERRVAEKLPETARMVETQVLAFLDEMKRFIQTKGP